MWDRYFNRGMSRPLFSFARLSRPVDGDRADGNLPWPRCGHFSGETASPAWFVKIGFRSEQRCVVYTYIYV